jgi:hypothetical protein
VEGVGPRNRKSGRGGAECRGTNLTRELEHLEWGERGIRMPKCVGTSHMRGWVFGILTTDHPRDAGKERSSRLELHFLVEML